MDPSLAIVSLLVPILALAIGLALLYVIVQAAIVKAMQKARREAWTEENVPEKAIWLTKRQREELAQHLARRAPVASPSSETI